MEPSKWVYLLKGLTPSTAGSIEEIHLEKIRVKLRRIFLTEKDRPRKVNKRYEYGGDSFVFYIDDGIKDDKFAQSFADAVACSLALVYDIAIDEMFTAISIPEDIITKDDFIRIKDIMGSEGVGSETRFKLMQSIGIPSEILNYVWRVVPAILESNPLTDATNFYRESIIRVWVADDDVFEVMCDDCDVPTSQAERARLETAYHNAFKAIESIIGEPSKDKRKVRNKLYGIGVNPNEKIGRELYGMKPRKETLFKKLKDMHETRDKQAAHAKTNAQRIIGYCELKDKQALARHILLSYIEYILQ